MPNISLQATYIIDEAHSHNSSIGSFDSFLSYDGDIVLGWQTSDFHYNLSTFEVELDDVDEVEMITTVDGQSIDTFYGFVDLGADQAGILTDGDNFGSVLVTVFDETTNMVDFDTTINFGNSFYGSNYEFYGHENGHLIVTSVGNSNADFVYNYIDVNLSADSAESVTLQFNVVQPGETPLSEGAYTGWTSVVATGELVNLVVHEQDAQVRVRVLDVDAAASSASSDGVSIQGVAGLPVLLSFNELANGDVAYIWHDRENDTLNYSTFDLSTGAFSPDVVVVSGATNEIRNDSISFTQHPDGTSSVIWTDFINDTIHAAVIDESVTLTLAETALDGPGPRHFNDRGFGIVEVSGHHVAYWSDTNNDTYEYELIGQIIDPDADIPNGDQSFIIATRVSGGYEVQGTDDGQLLVFHVNDNGSNSQTDVFVADLFSIEGLSPVTVVPPSSLFIEFAARLVGYNANDDGWIAGNTALDDALAESGYWIDEVITYDGFVAVGLLSLNGPPVLTIRGSSDLYSDWVIADTDPEGVGVTQLSNAWAQLGSAGLRDWIADNEADGIHITGHSLGGAQAQLLGALASSEGYEIASVTTFNSAGIPDDFSQMADHDLIGNVAHWVSAGDVVSLSGEGFLDGQVTVYNLDTVQEINLLTPITHFANAHASQWSQPAMYGSVYDLVPFDNAMQQPVQIAWLDAQSLSSESYSPIFINGFDGNLDPEYLTFLNGITVFADMLSHEITEIDGVRSSELAELLSTRGTVEENRITIGAFLRDISEALEAGFGITPEDIEAAIERITESVRILVNVAGNVALTLDIVLDAISTFSSWSLDTLIGFGEFTAESTFMILEWMGRAEMAVGDWTIETIETLGSWTLDTLAAFGEFGAESVAMVLNWMVDNGNDVSAWTANTVEGIGTWTSDTLSAVGQWGGDAIYGITGWSADAIAVLNNLDEDGLSALGDFTLASMRAFGNWSVETITAISQWSTEMFVATAAWGADTWEGLQDWSVNALQGLATWGVDGVIGISTWAQDALAGMATWGADTWSGLSSWSAESLDGLRAWGIDGVTRIGDWTEESLAGLSQWGDNIAAMAGWDDDTFEGILTWPADKLAELGQLPEELLSNLVDFTRNELIEIAGFSQDLMASIVEGGASVYQDALEAAQAAEVSLHQFGSFLYRWIHQNDLETDSISEVFQTPVEVSGAGSVSGTGIRETFTLSTADDFVTPGGGLDVIHLNGGRDVIAGEGRQLDGLLVYDFADDDELLFSGNSFSRSDINVTMGSAIIDIDLDQDGISDTTIVLAGDYQDVNFLVAQAGDGTLLTVEGVTDTAPPPRNFTGDDGANRITGTAEDNNISGLGGNDILFGVSGDDTLKGGSGDDKLKGGTGNDLLKGGSGNDILKGGSGADKLVGNDGADLLNGGSGDDILKGGNGNDTLKGGSGADILKGGTGSDIVKGGGGDDKLKGGGGADKIVGGKGDDKLWGGSGADTFVFSRGDGSDLIKDFNTNADMISITSGANSFSDLSLTLVGNDVEITFANVSITIEDLRISDVTADLFTF